MADRSTTSASKREELISQLYDRGIRNEALLRALVAIPRESFVDAPFRSRAWNDEALPIDCGQTISQPLTVAVMTDLLGDVRGKKILEIGTGSGFQAALLAELGARVWSVERHRSLLDSARRRLENLGYHVAVRVADGTVGWSEFAPYDRIVVTAGAPEVPSALVRQLGPGGRLVIPVGPIDKQRLQSVDLEEDGSTTIKDHGEARFVPLVGRRGWNDPHG